MLEWKDFVIGIVQTSLYQFVGEERKNCVGMKNTIWTAGKLNAPTCNPKMEQAFAMIAMSKPLFRDIYLCQRLKLYPNCLCMHPSIYFDGHNPSVCKGIATLSKQNHTIAILECCLPPLSINGILSYRH